MTDKRRMDVQQVPEPPDYVFDAMARFEREGQAGIDWQWFQVLTSEQRKEFDEWLIADNHPSIYEAGTAESRFRRVIKELVEERDELDAAYRKAGYLDN